MPVSGRGRASFQPLWADDVAACVLAALRADDAHPHLRYELAGPETLSHTEIVRTVLGSMGRRRVLVHVPTPLVSRGLRTLERVAGADAFATWDEAELVESSMTSVRGAADAEALGVRPQRMAAVLGAG
jgi:NADH dehydrogenase